MAVSVADLLAFANQQKGRPYVWGAAGPSSFDCSGLVTFVFGHFGINLPHRSQEQANYGTPVSPNSIQAGDLVFSDWGDGPNSHVGIALGPNEILSAPQTGDVVHTSTLNGTYRAHITAVRRITGVNGAGDGAPAVPAANGASEPAGFSLMKLVLPDSVNQMFGDAGKAIHAGLWLFNPSNQLRLAAGTAGAVCLLLGVLFLSREVRS